MHWYDHNNTILDMSHKTEVTGAPFLVPTVPNILMKLLDLPELNFLEYLDHLEIIYFPFQFCIQHTVEKEITYFAHNI